MNGIIVGAGIGGLSTAIAMRKHHIDVKIYETATQLLPVGAGILVPPNAMNILERYGVADGVRDTGVSIDSLIIFDNNGRKISETPAYFSKNGVQYQTVAIHRGILQDVLLSYLPSDILLTGKSCSHVNAHEGETEVFFEDDTSTKCRFIIGADGLHSKVRESIFPNQKLRYSGQVCWRGISDITLSPAWSKQLSEVWGAGIRFGFVPIDASRVYWYATKSVKKGSISENISIKKMLLDTYSEFPDPITEVISQTDNTLIIRDDINDLSPMKSWFSGAAVLVGDAAHASTPNIGQGGAQAIEDSWVLSEKIANCASLQEAFHEFQATRFSKVQRIVNVSWQIGQATNLTNRTACKIRNSLFRYVPDVIAKQQSRLIYDVPY